MDTNILVVDDDPVTLTYLSKILSQKGYNFATAVNGKLALEKLSQEKYSILLTDISMPEMDGKELVDIVNREHAEMISIVMSASIDVENLLATLDKNKAYSYLLKPLDPNKMINTLEQATEHYNVLQKAHKFSESEKTLYKNIMDTFKWKDELHSRRVTSIATEIIRQLNISFSHGGGIGSLLSTLSLVTSMTTFNEEKGVYELPKDLFQLIDTNYKATQKMLDSFSRAQTVLMKEEQIQNQETLGEFLSLVESVLGELEPAIQIKKQKVSLGKFPPNAGHLHIRLDKEDMRLALKELVINALKYSREKDNIYFMFFLKDDYFEIKILNPAYANEDGSVGIKGNEEKNVFEPFYRLSTIMDDSYYVHEDFSYGLGLPIIKQIISLHQASVFLYTVRNLSMETRSEDVCATVRFELE